MRLSGLGKFLTMLYDDRMDVFRTVKENDEDSTVNISYEPQPLYQDIKCRLSFESDDTGSDSEVDREPIRFNPKLFCACDVDLRAGDYVTVRRYADDGSVAQTYQGMVAKPSWYSTHQEAFLRIDEGA